MSFPSAELDEDDEEEDGGVVPPGSTLPLPSGGILRLEAAVLLLLKLLLLVMVLFESAPMPFNDGRGGGGSPIMTRVPSPPLPLRPAPVRLGLAACARHARTLEWGRAQFRSKALAMVDRMDSPPPAPPPVEAALLDVRDGRGCVDEEEKEEAEAEDDARLEILKFALNKDDNLLLRFSGAPVPLSPAGLLWSIEPSSVLWSLLPVPKP